MGPGFLLKHNDFTEILLKVALDPNQIIFIFMFQGLNPGLAIGEIKKMLALYKKEAKAATA